jgi:ADP-heptose:LPS heptosyltransferase
MSAEIKEVGNIKLRLSTSNEDVIRCCAASELIVTQHSGAVHMGAYAHSDVLVIFNGKPPIKGLQDTLRFRDNLTKAPLHFAFSLKEVEEFVKAYRP